MMIYGDMGNTGNEQFSAWENWFDNAGVIFPKYGIGSLRVQALGLEVKKGLFDQYTIQTHEFCFGSLGIISGSNQTAFGIEEAFFSILKLK